MFSHTPNEELYNELSRDESRIFAGVDVSIVNDRLANMSGLSSPLGNRIKPDKLGHLIPGQHSEIRSYQPSRSCCTNTRSVHDAMNNKMPSKIPDPVQNLIQIIKHLESYSSKP
jgi:hypothetical protein